MANTRSAQKRHRQSQKRSARNTAVRSAVKTLVKKAREAIASGDMKKAQEAARAATVALDRAASAGVLHARNAQRRISRIAHAAASKLSPAAK